MIVAADSDVLIDLEASVRRYVEARRAAPSHEAPSNESGDFRRAWRDFADLGWLGAAVDESHGGFGGPAEMAVIARELGAGLITEPYVESAVVPTIYLAAVAPLAGHTELLANALSADAIVTAAFDPCPRDPPVKYTETLEAVTLSGRIGPVLGGKVASWLLVPALDQHGQQAIVLVDCSAPGVHRETLATIEGGEATFVTFDRLILPLASVWPRDEQTAAASALATDAGIVAQAIQMIGVMDRCFELTRSYLLARRQFGQPLAEFQVLRHRLADMYAELEQARALVSAAVEALSSQHVAQRSRLASACKVRAIRASRVVGAQSIQLHGAIALTEEYEVGRCYTRLLVLEKVWGDLEFHVQRFSALGHGA